MSKSLDKKQELAAHKARVAARKKKQRTLSPAQKIGIIVAAIVFAVFTVCTSLASVFANSVAASQAENNQSESESDTNSVESVNNRFSAVVDDLNAKLAQNPTDTASLLALARYQTNWGVALSQLEGDDATAAANSKLDEAIASYDKLFELEPSDALLLNRAMCYYYKKDTNTALTELQEIVQNNPSYAPAWANLGMIYVETGDTDGALNAFQQASDNDPDNAYGVKSYATQQLAYLNQQASSDTQSDTSDENTQTETSGEESSSTSGEDASSSSEDQSTAEVQ